MTCTARKQQKTQGQAQKQPLHLACFQEFCNPLLKQWIADGDVVMAPGFKPW
jgi:hypothetical protein